MASPDGAAGKFYQIFREEIVMILHNLIQRTDADKILHLHPTKQCKPDIKDNTRSTNTH